jgi:hypothetical protein
MHNNTGNVDYQRPSSNVFVLGSLLPLAVFIIEACPPGPWGTPIVPVLKFNREVRICGDFSVTLNPRLKVAGRVCH